MRVRVWGEFACFTRPENKVERFSYPVMTPSAARGVLEAIFWKPQLAWVVEHIDVIRSGKYVQLRRNELQSPTGGERTQRYTIALRNVEYVIGARMVTLPGAPHNLAAYQDQFRRRLHSGSCFKQPYLGIREFAAYFEEAPADIEREDWSQDLGLMLLDINYLNSDPTQPCIGHAELFQARLDKGRMEIPQPGWLARRMTAKEDS